MTSVLNVVLYQPEIPANTGNIIRLCANCGANLHLIKPLGFIWDDKRLKRAGLDYHEYANISQYDSYAEFVSTRKAARVFACSTKGKTNYSDVSYRPDDYLLFGPETRGIPQEMLSKFDAQNVITIPMVADSRSLNLSNAVAIILYEAWRQNGFC